MPGKYDPDGIKGTGKTPKTKPTLPEIPHFLTEEEWRNSKNYQILKENSRRANMGNK